MRQVFQCTMTYETLAVSPDFSRFWWFNIAPGQQLGHCTSIHRTLDEYRKLETYIYIYRYPIHTRLIVLIYDRISIIQTDR